MNKINDIKLTDNKITLILEDKQEIVINKYTYSEFNLFVDKTLTEKEIKDIIDLNTYSNKLNDVKNLISKYSYTSFTLKEKLLRKKIDKEIVDKIIDNLINNNLINDKEYAKDYALSALSRLKGPFYIKHKLKEKGIDDKIIEEALTSLDNSIIDNNLKEIINKLNEKYKGLENRKEKIYRGCVIKGYSYNKIKEFLEVIK